MHIHITFYSEIYYHYKFAVFHFKRLYTIDVV